MKCGLYSSIANPPRGERRKATLSERSVVLPAFGAAR
jgi:hypothetical protein